MFDMFVKLFQKAYEDKNEKDKVFLALALNTVFNNAHCM
jgi:hypothetical protein